MSPLIQVGAGTDGLVPETDIVGAYNWSQDSWGNLSDTPPMIQMGAGDASQPTAGEPRSQSDPGPEIASMMQVGDGLHSMSQELDEAMCPVMSLVMFMYRSVA